MKKTIKPRKIILRSETVHVMRPLALTELKDNIHGGSLPNCTCSSPTVSGDCGTN
jgi:hypothetical protein